MPYATTDDGVRLYYEETGSGTPILFIHEFAGDHRSFAPQVDHFSGRYRCITYAARGYTPSDVPEDEAAYSQERAVADAITILDELGIEKAHIVGVSMGGFCSLHLGRLHPDRALSIVVGACGYGAHPDEREKFKGECEAIAKMIREEGPEAFAEMYAQGPARVQLQAKNPEAWELFAKQLAEHDQNGSYRTMLGVQRLRPSLYDLRDELSRMTVPCLILVGDEDDGCLDADVMLKRTIPSAGLQILPKTGHTCNLEDPAVFNAAVDQFITAAEQGRWPLRDARSQTGSITGIEN